MRRGRVGCLFVRPRAAKARVSARRPVAGFVLWCQHGLIGTGLEVPLIRRLLARPGRGSLTPFTGAPASAAAAAAIAPLSLFRLTDRRDLRGGPSASRCTGAGGLQRRHRARP
ncbi:MAG: hypothetical protein ABJC89_12930, partial [Acidobacteriota bacterium]